MLCFVEMCLKDEGGSLCHLTKLKENFALSTLKVSLKKKFSNHSESVTTMPTLRPWPGQPSRLCLLLGNLLAFLSQAWVGARDGSTPHEKSRC